MDESETIKQVFNKGRFTYLGEKKTRTYPFSSELENGILQYFVRQGKMKHMSSVTNLHVKLSFNR